MVRTKRGFTLIELLVVIAIIAILAAILFPVFARAREKARQATCSSNLKQVALAAKMYTPDYDERFPIGYGNWGYAGWYVITQPPTARGTATRLRLCYWTNSLQAYTKNWQLFQCPSASPRVLWNSPGNPAVPISPTFNWLLSGNTEAQVNHPAWCIMVWEGCGAQAFSSYATEMPFYMGGPVPARAGSTNAGMGAAGSAWVHNGGSNKAYADGHVKWTKEPGRWDRSVWARVSSTGVPQSYWWDGHVPWLFRPWG